MRLLLLSLCLLATQAVVAQTIPPVGTDATFDVATWNIRQFGENANAETQFDNVLAVLSQAEIDLWALQEMNDEADFNALVAALGDGWASDWTDGFGPLGYGFIYRTDVVDRISAGQILESESFAFAGRPPLMLRADIVLPDTVVKDVRLIDIHAKAGGDRDDYDRRTDAAEALKNYVDNFLAIDAPILILGDFNDELNDSIYNSQPSPYQNFLDDPAHYRFLNASFDQPGSVNDTNTFCNSNSCSSGSVLDYILATEPLFVEASEDAVARYDAVLEGFDNYRSSTSDHVPVWARLDFRLRPTGNEDARAPQPFALRAPFPNPFRTATTLTYSLPTATDVQLDVFDTLGRRVATVERGTRPAGVHEVTFQSGTLAPGLYIARLSADGRTATRRLVLVP